MWPLSLYLWSHQLQEPLLEALILKAHLQEPHRLSPGKQLVATVAELLEQLLAVALRPSSSPSPPPLSNMVTHEGLRLKPSS